MRRHRPPQPVPLVAEVPDEFVFVMTQGQKHRALEAKPPLQIPSLDSTSGFRVRTAGFYGASASGPLGTGPRV